MSETAALDLIIGATMEGMRRIAHGQAHGQHAAAVTASIWRGLGVEPARARRISTKPLPLFGA